MMKHLHLRQILLGAFFIIAGCAHFIWTGFYQRMIPPMLPAPEFLVYLSGVAEIIGGILLFASHGQLLARCYLLALLVAIFPANIYMAMRPELFPEFSPNGLWYRLPLQLFFVAWVWWATEEKPQTGGESAEQLLEKAA